MQSLTIPWYVLEDSYLSSTSKILLSVIISDINLTGENCKRTHKQFSELLGIAPLAVTQCLHKMHDSGFIVMHKGLSEKNRPQYSYSIKEMRADE